MNSAKVPTTHAGLCLGMMGGHAYGIKGTLVTKATSVVDFQNIFGVVLSRGRFR